MLGLDTYSQVWDNKSNSISRELRNEHWQTSRILRYDNISYDGYRTYLDTNKFRRVVKGFLKKRFKKPFLNLGELWQI